MKDALGMARSKVHQRCQRAAGDGSFLQQFFQATADMDAAQRGAYLEHPPEGAPDIDDAHHVSCNTPLPSF